MSIAVANPYVWWHPAAESRAPASPPELPVVIGVADVRQKGVPLDEAKEPLALMADAVRAAAEDSGNAAGVLAGLDSVSITSTWTWEYADLPSQLARALGKDPDAISRREYTSHAGNQPGRLFDDACKNVAAGRVRIAVVTGGEALDSLQKFANARRQPPWTPSARKVAGTVGRPGEGIQGDTVHIRHGAFAPIHFYPMVENALRARRGQSYADNERESAELYAEFARNAAKLPAAWNHGSIKTREEIQTVGEKNRMICYPYPLLQNAFNTVNLAGAVIVTSLRVARELGIPDSKLAYPLGGAGTSDSGDYLLRPYYDRSNSIAHSLDMAMRVSNVTIKDIDALDIYSCFPIVPKLACIHLGVPIVNPPIPISICGGLTSFGGAGNNYSLHSLAEMVRRIRAGTTKTGLVLCNGGYSTYIHVCVLGSRPNGMEYPSGTYLPALLDAPRPPALVERVGAEPQPCFVETYTVDYDRKGKPVRLIAIVRMNSAGRERALCNGRDAAAIQAAVRARDEGREVVGMRGFVAGDGKGRNVFWFAEGETARM